MKAIVSEILPFDKLVKDKGYDIGLWGSPDRVTW